MENQVVRKGFRAQPNPTKGKVIQNLQDEITKLNSMMKVLQNIIVQNMQNQKSMGDDLNSASMNFSELQYKVLALIKTSGQSDETLNKLITEMKETDFNAMALKEDTEKSLLPVETVTENSTITITTTAPEGNTSIFRSRFLVKEARDSKFRELVVGKKIGDTFDSDINGVTHAVTILDIKEPTTKTE